jgi:Domain of unknown function (DUF6794)
MPTFRMLMLVAAIAGLGLILSSMRTHAIAETPTTLEEAFRELDRLLPADHREEFKGKPEIDAVANDFELRMLIRREWLKSEGSALRHHLHSLGVRHLDYSYVVAGAYWQYLNGQPIKIERYIAGGPNTLEDAFQELDRLLPANTKQIFKSKPEQKAVIDAHFGLAMFIRNEWFRSGRSSLPGRLHSLGARSFDDMSDMILRSYWRHLNGTSIDIEKQGACYERWWQKQRRLIAEAKDKRCHEVPSFSCPDGDWSSGGQVCRFGDEHRPVAPPQR